MEKDQKVRPKKFVIVGAGLAGLTCAKILSERGMSVTVLERHGMIGGLASGIREDGFSIDMGPHYMVLPKKSRITDDIKHLLGEGNLVDFPDFGQSHKSYFSGNILDHFPSLKRVIKERGHILVIRVALQVLGAGIKRIFLHDDSSSGQEYLRNNFGGILYDNWFKHYYASIFSGEDLPKEFVKKQFPPPSLRGLFAHQATKGDQGQAGGGHGYFDCYPRFGMIDLIEKIGKRIAANGGEIVLKAQIRSISHGRNSKKVVFEKDGKSFEVCPDVIIYGIPPSAALGWFDEPPQDVSACVKTPPPAHNSIMVCCFLDSRRVFDGWIMNIFEPEFSFFRISQQSHLSPHIAPEGKCLLTAEIRCETDDRVWGLDDASIFEIVRGDLERMRFFDVGKIFGHKIIRIPRVYPRPDTAESGDERLSSYINSFEGEFVLGHSSDAGQEISGSPVGGGHRLGGMLVAMSGAYSTAMGILEELSKQK